MATRKRNNMKSFKFGIDPIPDWFMDMVTANFVILKEKHESNNPFEFNLAHAVLKIDGEHSFIIDIGDDVEIDESLRLIIHRNSLPKKEVQKFQITIKIGD